MRTDAGALIWAIVLGVAGSLGLVVGLGHRLDWSLIAQLTPIGLLLVGAIGLVLSRGQHHTNPPEPPL